MFKRMIETAACILVLLLQCASLQAHWLPGWLDSPTRSNPHDPRSQFYSSPFVQTAPSPPVFPTPGPTPLVVTVRDQLKNPVAGAWVMVNSDAAGAQATDGLGRAAFPGTPLPADVHIFTTDGTQPRTFSYFGVTVPAIAVDAARNMANSKYSVTSTLLPLSYSTTVSSSVFVRPTGLRATIIPLGPALPLFFDAPQAAMNASQLEFTSAAWPPGPSDFAGAWLSSQPAPISPGIVTFSGSASPAGFLNAPLSITVTGIPSCGPCTVLLSFDVLGGYAPDDLYFILESMGRMVPFFSPPPVTSTTATVFFPPSFSYFELHRYESNGSSVSGTSSSLSFPFPTPPSSVQIPLDLGTVQITQTPNFLAPTIRAWNSTPLSPTAWSFSLSSGTAPFLSWEGIRLNVPAGATFTAQLPAVLPAAVALTHAFPSGATLSVAASAFEPRPALDPADIPFIGGGSVAFSSEWNLGSWASNWLPLTW